MAPVTAKNNVEMNDADIDSLSVLPLGALPVQTEGLRRVRLVKDSRLQSAIEVFSGHNIGSGLISPKILHDQFPALSADDYNIVRRVGELQSFDVYSIRICLRNMGIKVDNTEYLCLSEAKQQELQTYIRPFTDRLIHQVYGDGGAPEVGEVTDVSALFHDPDINAAREKLENIADSLSIPLTDVPKFLEDYGDIYLSVAYYRSCLDKVRPIVDDFLAATQEIQNHPQINQNVEMVKICVRLENKFKELVDVLLDRFDEFSRSTDEMWRNMSAEKFSTFKKLVEDNHTAMGSLLCTLSVKMNLWHARFPTRHAAGPNRKADFIMTDMRQGV